MSTFRCDIVTPESLLFSEEVNFVSVPGSEGELGILAKHAPVVSTLKLGAIRVKREENSEPLAFAVTGGYVEIDGSKVVVLATRAVDASTVTLEEARASKAAAEQKLSALAEDDSRAAFYHDEIAFFELLESLHAARA
jgi:F-type H+-transporting ATPase subunit epsilon